MVGYRGMTALVTGASMGIGAAFTDELAARGTNLILVARSEQLLQERAASLQARFGVRVDVLPTDLCVEHAARDLVARVDALGLQVDLLINNAGASVYGRLAELDYAALHRLLMLNTVTLAELTAQVLPAMVARKSGAIINIASAAGLQPVPYLAAYSASKAFVINLSEALWAENRQHGIRVVTVCPGATDTPMAADIAAQNPATIKNPVPPQQVVALSLRALERNKMTVVDGRWSALTTLLTRLMPRRMVVLTAERLQRPAK